MALLPRGPLGFWRDAFNKFWRTGMKNDAHATRTHSARRKHDLESKRDDHLNYATEITGELIQKSDFGIRAGTSVPWNPEHLLTRNNGPR